MKKREGEFHLRKIGFQFFFLTIVSVLYFYLSKHCLNNPICFRAPIDLITVIDRSGSMTGEKISLVLIRSFIGL
jgi:hypothetical protein